MGGEVARKNINTEKLCTITLCGKVKDKKGANPFIPPPPLILPDMYKSLNECYESQDEMWHRDNSFQNWNEDRKKEYEKDIKKN